MLRLQWPKKHRYSQSVESSDEISDSKSIVSIDPGWKPLIKAGASITALCLAINVAVLIWMHARTATDCPAAPDDEAKTIFCGDCAEVSRIKIWSHLGINIVSTLILATSTACMQVLSAPTRAEVDSSHKKGAWMEIGNLSVGNLKKINPRRTILYVILVITSIPIHFLYNSIFLSTQGVYDSLVLLATPEFITNSSSIDEQTILSLIETSQDRAKSTFDYFNSTDVYPAVALPPSGLVLEITNSFKLTNSSYRNLTASDCLRKFQSLATQNPNVLIVTSSVQKDQLIDMTFSEAFKSANWPCVSPDRMFNSSSDFLSSCDVIKLISESYYKDYNISLPFEVGLPVTEPLPDGNWTMDYCLLQDGDNFRERCSIIFSTTLISIIILMNTVKLVVIVYVVSCVSFKPLVTVGDAISSFMQDPDPYTEGMAARSDASIRQCFQFEYSRALNTPKRDYSERERILRDGKLHKAFMHSSSLMTRGRRWARAPSGGRWVMTTLLFMPLFYVAVVTLGLTLSDGSLSTQGFGGSADAPTIDFQGSFLSQVMFVNLPQFLISCFYVNYMGLLTSMLTASELSDFTREAKAMRVTPPRRGSQRSTYFLQVPYRYSLPVLITMMALHWIVSEAFFVVRVLSFNIAGDLENPVLVHTVGYSVLGLLLAVIASVVIAMFPILLGLRRYPSGMPLIVNNSIAISIACHPFPEEPEDGHEQPLKYGLIKSANPHLNPPVRVGFSASNVERLVGGEKVEAPRCLSGIIYPGIDLVGNCSLSAPMAVLAPYRQPWF